MTNLILNTDSYKPSHWLQYPPNTEYVYYYIESRGSAGDNNQFNDLSFPLPMKEHLFTGLQPFVMEYLTKPITREDIEEAAEVLQAHGEPFNREGWEYILEAYDGYLPLEIRAIPEGTVLPVKNALVSVVNTDPKCFWLGSYIETALLRAVWYPTTVATISWRIKQMLKKSLMKTVGSTEGVDFMLHDFGARGVSSAESSAIGGTAHLIPFKGTDNVLALMHAREYYDETMAGFSIPAAEHSSITTWGQDREVDAYRNMLKQFASKGSLVAVVSDSYDIVHAVRNLWGQELRQEVIDSGATVIIRPDSGDPISTVITVLNEAAKAFGTTINDKGYRVLNYVKVIQGDGIEEKSIRRIIEAVEINGFAISNLAFGMGGALLQHMNRDTLKFAMKASAAKIDGKWVDVFKNPVTDKGKKSKRGKVGLVKNIKSGKMYTAVTEDVIRHPAVMDYMQPVFVNGKLIRKQTLEEIREHAEKS